MIEIRFEYIISFVLAFLVAFFATPMVKKIAFKVGAVDVPKDNRRMHKKPIALMGGLAIICGFLVAILYNFFGSSFKETSFSIANDQITQFIGFLVGMGIILTVGIVDDIRPLSAKIKFPLQLIAAFIVVRTGTQIQVVTNPFNSDKVSSFLQYPIVSYALTMLWIVGITNAFNLIDGLDGLSAGVSSIASLTLFFVSVIGGQYEIAIITVALAGSTLGFLPFNFNPAKIFMGDTGATFLGFTLGVISIQGLLKSYTAIAIAIPLLTLGLPLFDTVFAILRRIVSGKSIMEADRGHLHHRLIDMGLSHKQSVSFMYVISGTLGLIAIVLADKGLLSAIILIILISVFIIGGARYMSEIGTDEIEENAVKIKIDEEQNKDLNNKIAMKEPNNATGDGS